VSREMNDVYTVYASFDNHKAGDKKPYVAKSTDLGRTWTLITGDLPERGTVYVVIEDNKDRNLLFAGTEFGLYVSTDAGQRWTRLRGGQCHGCRMAPWTWVVYGEMVVTTWSTG